MNKFECVIPILNVGNFAASMDYYVNKLGFTKKWDWGTPPTFGCAERGKAALFFCEGGQGQRGIWMSLFLDDVDVLHQEYVSTGATIREAPRNMPWGTREMNIEDPDGNRLRMGSDATGPFDPTNPEPFFGGGEF
jgi:catechol 2,3-dioxygenase-like lactoylglutathione lyase family enzyme